MGEKKEESTPKVKIKAITAIRIADKASPDGFTIVQPGAVVEVTAEEAKEFCDRKYTGYSPCYGYQPEMILDDGQANPLAKKTTTRAVRVA